MAQAFVDISMIGDKALQKKFKRLADKDQVKAVRNALVKSSTRIKKEIVRRTPVQTDNLPGGQVAKPGTLKRAMAAVKPKSTSLGTIKRHGFIGRLIPFPSRAELGIPAGSKWFYPLHVEYGHPLKGGGHVPPVAFVRGAVNDNEAIETQRIGSDIGKWIERAAAKK